MGLHHRSFVQALIRDQHRLLAYVLVIVADDHLAEDVVQEALTLAFERLDEFNDESHLYAWLRETARRKALELLRRTRRQPRVFDESLLDLLEDQWRQLEPVETSATLEALRGCLEQLTPFARQIIDARYGRNLTGEKLATELGRKFNTVYSALSRTHAALAECVRRRLTEGAIHHD